jgi:NAD-dependent deacetylase
MNRVKSIVVLTGAGISAESGIQTFRADDGLWEEHRVEDVATPEAFERDPWLVQNFYNQRRRPLLDNAVHANKAHLALAELEREFTGEFLLVTQNIDNLHERAGSQNILHMHGEVLKMRCSDTNKIFDCFADIEVADLCDCCGLPNNLRPHIVWFGEMPLYMEQITSAISSCDLFISIGTSGNVYPAAGFVQMAKQSGAQTLEVNLEESLLASDFDQGVYGKAGDVLPAWVKEFLAR